LSIHLTLEDASNEICTRLIAELSAELAQRYNDDTVAAGFHPDQVRGPRAGFVVAWLDDQPVGCGALRPTDDELTAEIKRMYVRSETRGKGISRMILHRLETLAAEFGFRTVILETGIYQPEAIGLYENSGYQRRACYDRYTDDPLSVYYEKRLVPCDGQAR
jgi:putative acetyltransferase